MDQHFPAGKPADVLPYTARDIVEGRSKPRGGWDIGIRYFSSNRDMPGRTLEQRAAWDADLREFVDELGRRP